MDFRMKTDCYRYGVRVCAIILKNQQLLTYKVDTQNHLVGGAIKVGESSCRAMLREVKEELGLEALIKDLMFIVENRFTHQGELHHNIEFYYRVEILGEAPQNTLDAHAFECEWLPLERLTEYDVRPKFLKQDLVKWDGNIRHLEVALEKKL